MPNRNHSAADPLSDAFPSQGRTWGHDNEMNIDKSDPLAHFGLEAIDLRWTLKDIASQRSWIINKDHLPRLVELGLVEMREGAPHLTRAGETAAWDK